jgi:hypothetical protein
MTGISDGQRNAGTGGIRDDVRQSEQPGPSTSLSPKAGRRQRRKLLEKGVAKETTKNTPVALPFHLALFKRSQLALFFCSVPLPS